MLHNIEQLYFSCDRSGSARPVSDSPSSCGYGARRISFTDLRDMVFRRQLEGEYFPKADRAFALELAAIMTEVKFLPPDNAVIIGGETLTASLVCEVFDCITHSHIETVIEKYRAAGTVMNKRAYLRTMLYNSVFEHESELEEFVKKNL